MRASAAWPQDANKIVWVSEHDALRADMDDLAAAIGALDSQLAAGKALTAWQVRAFLGSTTSVLQPVLHAGHGSARRSSAPPASCVAPRPTGEAARGVRERQREHGEWRSGRQRARQHRRQRVSGAATDRSGRRVLLRRTPAAAQRPRRARRWPRSATRGLSSSISWSTITSTKRSALCGARPCLCPAAGSIADRRLRRLACTAALCDGDQGIFFPWCATRRPGLRQRSTGATGLRSAARRRSRRAATVRSQDRDAREAPPQADSRP